MVGIHKRGKGVCLPRSVRREGGWGRVKSVVGGLIWNWFQLMVE